MQYLQSLGRKKILFRPSGFHTMPYITCDLIRLQGV